MQNRMSHPVFNALKISSSKHLWSKACNEALHSEVNNLIGTFPPDSQCLKFPFPVTALHFDFLKQFVELAATIWLYCASMLRLIAVECTQ